MPSGNRLIRECKFRENKITNDLENNNKITLSLS